MCSFLEIEGDGRLARGRHGDDWRALSSAGTNTVPVLLLFPAPSMSHSNPRTKLLTCQLNPSWPPPMNTPLLFPLLKFRPERVSLKLSLRQAPPMLPPR